MSRRARLTFAVTEISSPSQQTAFQPPPRNSFRGSRPRGQGSRPELATLAQRIATGIEGAVDFTDAGRALYTCDASNYRQVPLGVVFPAGRDDIKHIARCCREAELPVLMRGAGTSQNGQTVNEAVVLDCSRYMNRVLSIDVENAIADIEPGVVCDQLKAAAEPLGLTFGPDPATHSRCTLGGMIGNNSCGPHSMLAGKTVENVLELDVLTSDGIELTVGPTTEKQLTELSQRNDRIGEIYRELKVLVDEHAERIRQKYPTIKRRVSGYNLDQLLPENGFNVARALVGSEGTCVSILGARVTLVENPRYKQLLVLGFENIFEAGDTVREILPFKPIAMEGLDSTIVGGLKSRGLRQREIGLLPEGKAWILMELAASSEQLLTQSVDEFVRVAGQMTGILECKPIYGDDQIADIWSIREQGASATAFSLDPNVPDPVVGWEDTAVDPLQLGDYLRDFYALVDRYGYTTSLYGHFGDGCIHARITFDTRSEEGVQQWRNFSQEIAQTVVRYGGSLSGEHGDGQAKAEFLPIMFGSELVQAFERFKTIWDPSGLMNPRKVVNPYRMDENLKHGPDYKTPVVETVMQFEPQGGGFGRALERCIGMGKCRSATGAMCPTYQASLDESLSTRGRARMLLELTRGDDVVKRGFADSEIKDSLTHCLSCKACKISCPTHVDIAAYKSEFMARYYQSNRRPLVHKVIGRLGDYLPGLSRFSTVLNGLSRVPILRHGVQRLLGFATDRKIPVMATRSLRQRLVRLQDEMPSVVEKDFQWFGPPDGAQVVLWLDTFNSHYKPQVIESAMRLLVHLGFRTGIARSHFCCGRPLYEYGLLAEAKDRLQRIMENFHAKLPPSSCIVVLEPSCLSVFKDELLRQLGEVDQTLDLAERTMTLADFLVRNNIRPDSADGDALLHLHCHHKSLTSAAAERTYLEQCFSTVTEPEPGCCGMAGVFGLQQSTRELSGEIFKKRLSPALQAVPDNTVLITNGFSCQEQIADLSGQKTLHVAEVLERKFLGRLSESEEA